MNDDLLKRATEVVRDRYDGESQLAAGSEDRILTAFERRTRHGRRLPLIAVPLVAALLASAAWAAAGGRLHAILHPRVVESSESPRLGARISAPQASAPPTEASAAVPEFSAPVPHFEAPSARAKRVPAPVNSPRTSQPAPSPSEAEIDALYRAAHQAQFSGGDPNQALLLWDRYLSAAPNGALSPEARYNRAIALARLGRKAEAATALEPFARGDYGGYRKTEAESLLKVLRPDTAP